MARYRFDIGGSVKEGIRRADVFRSTCETWGVTLTGLSLSANTITVDTDITVTNAMMGTEDGTGRQYTWLDHVGFVVT